MDKVKNNIEHYSHNIAYEISNMPYINIKEINQIVKVRMIMSFTELLQTNLNDIETYRSSLLQELKVDIPNWRKIDIQNELTMVNSNKKTYNRAKSELKNYSEYKLLISHCTSKFGQEFMDEFFKTVNK